MFLLYIIYCIILFVIVGFILIKIKYKFWSIQPVFHFYNLKYWFFPPGIIEKDDPNTNKYTNLKDIEFIDYQKLSSEEKNQFVNFIQKYFLNTKQIKYKPKKNHILPYFENTKNSYFSLFNDKDYIIDNNNQIKTTKKLIAVMTSRLLNVSLNNNEFTTYYVDYLCVHDEHRGKGIAQQIIQTHDYYQRINTIIPTSLFKREGQLNAIVPIVVYRTYGFNIEYWNYNNKIHSSIQLIEFNKTNINLLSNFIKSKKNDFSLHICPDIHILLDLINSKNLIIYGYIQNNQILSVYFFKDSATFYNQRKAIDCIASINNSKDDMIFIVGFSLILNLLRKTFSYLLIENISHNYKIIENIIKKHSPYLVSPTAYYFYNFAMTPVKEDKALIIC